MADPGMSCGGGGLHVYRGTTTWRFGGYWIPPKGKGGPSVFGTILKIWIQNCEL